MGKISNNHSSVREAPQPKGPKGGKESEQAGAAGKGEREGEHKQSKVKQHEDPHDEVILKHGEEADDRGADEHLLHNLSALGAADHGDEHADEGHGAPLSEEQVRAAKQADVAHQILASDWERTQEAAEHAARAARAVPEVAVEAPEAPRPSGLLNPQGDPVVYQPGGVLDAHGQVVGEKPSAGQILNARGRPVNAPPEPVDLELPDGRTVRLAPAAVEVAVPGEAAAASGEVAAAETALARGARVSVGAAGVAVGPVVAAAGYQEARHEFGEANAIRQEIAARQARGEAPDPALEDQLLQANVRAGGGVAEMTGGAVATAEGLALATGATASAAALAPVAAVGLGAGAAVDGVYGMADGKAEDDPYKYWGGALKAGGGAAMVIGAATLQPEVILPAAVAVGAGYLIEAVGRPSQAPPAYSPPAVGMPTLPPEPAGPVAAPAVSLPPAGDFDYPPAPAATPSLPPASDSPPAPTVPRYASSGNVQ